MNWQSEEHWRVIQSLLTPPPAPPAPSVADLQGQAEAHTLYDKFLKLQTRVRLFAAGVVVTHGTGNHHRKRGRRGHRKH